MEFSFVDRHPEEEFVCCYNGAIIFYNKSTRTFCSKLSRYAAKHNDVIMLNYFRSADNWTFPTGTSIKQIDWKTGKVILENNIFIKNIFSNLVKEQREVFEDTRCDTRAVVFPDSPDKLYLTYNRYKYTRWEDTDLKEAHMMICFEKEAKLHEVLLSNIPNGYGTDFEKNWLFIPADYPGQDEQKLSQKRFRHFVYTLYPQVITCRTSRQAIAEEEKSKPKHWHSSKTWNIAIRHRPLPNIPDLVNCRLAPEFHIRGGATPVFVDGLWWFFAHTRELLIHERFIVNKWIPERSKVVSREVILYRMIIVVCQDSEENFQLEPKAYTFPLEFDSLRIKTTSKDHLRAIFPTGACFDETEQMWIICAGMNDMEQVIFRIPHSEVLSMLEYT